MRVESRTGRFGRTLRNFLGNRKGGVKRWTVVVMVRVLCFKRWAVDAIEGGGNETTEVRLTRGGFKCRGKGKIVYSRCIIRSRKV